MGSNIHPFSFRRREKGSLDPSTAPNPDFLIGVKSAASFGRLRTLSEVEVQYQP
jgi:hypothetical protein